MDFPEGYNWFLILITVIVVCLVFVAVVYILIHFQHPEDKNQAWFPKFVVVAGLSLAICEVLMFPLDVANRAACNSALVESSCTLTLPMSDMWQGAFITNLVLVFAVIPFTLFFYEADSDFSLFQKIKTAGVWTFGVMAAIALILGISYGLAGYVIYPTQELTSGMLDLQYIPSLTTGTFNITNDVNGFGNGTLALVDIGCVKPGMSQPGFDTTIINDGTCDGYGLNYVASDWKIRVSIIVYIMAVQSVIGWILFMVFAGVGLFCAPVDWIQQYLGRPRSVITKSEFITRARVLAVRAKELRALSDMLKRQDREGGRNRKWRANFKRLQTALYTLEEDEYQLDRVFPQGADGDVRWVLYQIGYILLGLFGVIGIGISGLWFAHIVVYMLPPIPIHPLLNDMFTALDGVFPMFGVVAFTLLCGYMMVVAVKGNFMMGLNLVVVNLYPMRAGATMMSSFLVNEALILLMAGAVIQFCAQAFSVYASGTAIFDVFGNQVMYLQGIRAIYSQNVFLYMFICIGGIAMMIMISKGPKQWKRKKPEDAYEM